MISSKKSMAFKSFWLKFSLVPGTPRLRLRSRFHRDSWRAGYRCFLSLTLVSSFLSLGYTLPWEFGRHFFRTAVTVLINYLVSTGTVARIPQFFSILSPFKKVFPFLFFLCFCVSFLLFSQCCRSFSKRFFCLCEFILFLICITPERIRTFIYHLFKFLT